MKTDRVVYENDELKPGIQDETESKVNWWEQLLKLSACNFQVCFRQKDGKEGFYERNF